MKALLTLLAVLAIVVPASALSIDFGPTGQPVAAGFESFEGTVDASTSSLSATLGTGNTVTITAYNDPSLGAVAPARIVARDDSSMAGIGTSYAKHFRSVVLDPAGTAFSQWTSMNHPGDANYNGELQQPSWRIEVAGLTPSTVYDVALGIHAKWNDLTYITLSGIGTSVNGSFEGDGLVQPFMAANAANIGGQFSTDAQGVLTVSVVYDNTLTHTDGDWAGPGTGGGNDPMLGLSLMTINVPEPATMALLVLGGLSLIRRRR